MGHLFVINFNIGIYTIGLIDLRDYLSLFINSVRGDNWNDLLILEILFHDDCVLYLCLLRVSV